MKAVKHFKRLIDPSELDQPMRSILGEEVEPHFVQPPMEMEPDEDLMIGIPEYLDKDQALNAVNQKLHLGDRKRQLESVNSVDASSKQGSASYTASIRSERTDSGPVSGFKRGGDSSGDVQGVSSGQLASPQVPLSRASSTTTKRSIEGNRGHARDPLEEGYPYLFIGPSTYVVPQVDETDEPNPDIVSEEPDGISAPELSDTDVGTDLPGQIVSESPGAAEFNIYETAYRQEIERIRKHARTLQEGGLKVYLTRRVEGMDDVTKLLEEHGSTEAAHEPRSKTLPVLGTKRAFHTGPQPTVGGINSLLQQERQEQHEQQQTSSSSSIPDVTPEAAPVDPDTVPQNPKTKLRGLIGRVRGSRG